MTPEQNYANELIEKFYKITESGLDYDDGKERSKQCAIICVKNTIEAIKNIFGKDEDKQPDIVFYQQVLECLNKQ